MGHRVCGLPETTSARFSVEGNPSFWGISPTFPFTMGERGPAGGAGVGETQTNSSGDNNKKSYSEVTRRRFPNITVDMVPEGGEQNKHLGFSVIADVIFDHLRLKKGEFLRFQTFREEGGRITLKIRTVKDIDVKQRFGERHEFEVPDNKGNVHWKASIRGAVRVVSAEREESLKLRVINPPEEASMGEVREQIEKFAEVRSRIIEEVVPVEEEPRLAGYPTGILHIWIKKIPTVPKFIMIRRMKVRVQVAIPPDVCLRCREKGHRVAECHRTAGAGDGMPTGISEENQDYKDESATGNEDEKPNGIQSEGENSEGDLAPERDIEGPGKAQEKRENPKMSGPSIVRGVKGGSGGVRGGGSKRQGLRSTS